MVIEHFLPQSKILEEKNVLAIPRVEPSKYTHTLPAIILFCQSTRSKSYATHKQVAICN